MYVILVGVSSGSNQSMYYKVGHSFKWTACNNKISPAVAAAEEMCAQLQHSKNRLMVISANSNNMYDSQSCAAKNETKKINNKYNK